MLNVCWRKAKQHDDRMELEMDDETKTAHYARTEGNRIIFECSSGKTIPDIENAFIVEAPTHISISTLRTQTAPQRR